MRTCIPPLIIAAFVAGCTANGMGTHGADEQGLVELRVDTGSLAAGSITRATAEAAGISQDLVLNPITGTFDGSLMLAVGMQRVVVRAFSGTALVGLSHPASVDVQSGMVTRVTVRILDLTGDAPPAYGPIFDSLSFPTTAQVGVPAPFAISVIAPAGDPVTYAWSSSCADSSFSAPGAATTSWSKPAEGSCTITVTAASSGFTITQNFMIVVFAAGAGTGAVTVTGVFVGAPGVSISLSDLGCNVFPGSNASCASAIASPATTAFGVSAFDWGASSTPGTLELSDNCGGRFGMSGSRDSLFGAWLPPVAGGLCILTARATNGDGVVGTTSAAILVRPGMPATSQPPHIDARYLSLGCAPFSPSPVDCGQVHAGFMLIMSGQIDWRDGLPGTASVSDDCADSLPAQVDPTFLSAMWMVPATPGASCTRVRATSLQGSSTEVSARYTIAVP
jgi:hypothetical protein